MKEVYRLSRSFPPEELYGMTSQIRRASASILANIAEGSSRYTYADKAAKFVIARGECAEGKAFLYMVIALEFITEKDAEQAFVYQEDVARMLSGLIESRRSHSSSRTDTRIY